MCASATAFAQADDGADDTAPVANHQDPVRAQQLYELGKKLYAASEFEEAARLFSESFELDARPAAIYNEGRCHEAAGEKKAALVSYKKYLELEAESTAAEEVRIRILALERQIELAKGPDDEGAPAKIVDITPTEPGENLRLAGMVSGGLGAAMLIAGTYFGWESKRLSDRLSGRDPIEWTDGEQRDHDRGETYEKAAVGLWIAGGVVGSAGLVMYLVGLNREDEPLVTPSVTPDSVGASVSIRF